MRNMIEYKGRYVAIHNMLVPEEKETLTVEKLEEMFPAKKGRITKEVAEWIDKTHKDPEFNGDEFIDSMVSYKDVLNGSQYSLKSYINAIKFVSYLVAENDNSTQAYIRARGDEEFVKSKIGIPTDSKEYKYLTNAAGRYRQHPLVKKLLIASQMPLHLMRQKYVVDAADVLHDEMFNAKLSKDRIAAADAVLRHIKPPENMSVQLDIGMNQESKDAVSQLKEQMAESVAMQRKMLDLGVDMSEVQKLNITGSVIDAEVE